jgi:hypothetical protein
VESLRLVLLHRLSEVPVIQVAASDTKVGSKAEPAQVWSQQPSTHRVDLAPDIGKIAHSPAKSEDIDSRSNWAAHSKVQWSPDEVQGQLNTVESSTLLGKSDSLRIDGSSSSRPGTVSCVAHGGIDCGPYWSKDEARWVKRWLLQRPILPLCVTCYVHVNKSTYYEEGRILRLIENPIAVPQATGRSIAAAGFEKRKLGRVNEGM